MWAIRNETLAQVLDKYVQDPKLRSILSVFWPYYGLPPSKLSGFYYAVATAAYIRFGGHYIKQRSQDLSDALMAAIEDSGGKVLLGSEVTDITMKNGSVTGVVLDNGKKLSAKAVISNASVPATMEMLSRNTDSKDLPRKAAKYSQKLKTFRPSLSTFLVWLGLIVVVKKKFRYSNVFFYNRTIVQSFIPQYRNSEHYYGKRYKSKISDTNP